MKKNNNQTVINMRGQKSFGKKQAINSESSVKKIHRRMNTQIQDIGSSKYIKCQIKKTLRTASKPKFLDVYSKYPVPMVKQNTQRNKVAKLVIQKPISTIKHLRTQPNQHYRAKHLHTQSNYQPSQQQKQRIQFKQQKHKQQKYKGQFHLEQKYKGQGQKEQNRKSINEGNYQFQGVAGKGTFGVVYFGIDKQTGRKIAVKKVFQDKKYKNRQHIILQMLHHTNVLQMKDSFLSYEGQEEYLNIIMDYYPDNLYQVIKKKQLTAISTKLYAYQIFRGLNYLSMLSIAHRDMKPQNILVDLYQNKSIICDFGSAKKLVSSQANLAYICSRCYRAPQLIFGVTSYNTQIDMWSMGCILVEMVNGVPPFLADSQIDQLIEIIKVLGTPTQHEVQEMNPNYDMNEYGKFPKIKFTPWRNLLKTKDPLLIDLITKTLVYSPIRRITPAEALFHEYFDDLRDQLKFYELKQNLKTIPDLFDYSEDELKFISIECKQNKTKSLVPKWYKTSKFGLTNINLNGNKSSTISNMMTKPSSSQGSRVTTGLNYIGKKSNIYPINK